MFQNTAEYANMEKVMKKLLVFVALSDKLAKIKSKNLSNWCFNNSVRCWGNLREWSNCFKNTTE